MKNKTFINLVFNLLLFLTIYLISTINNIIATILITFLFTNIILIINEVLTTKLLHKESQLVIIISQIKEMNNKSDKVGNIIELFYPSIFTTILAIIIHSIYLLTK